MGHLGATAVTPSLAGPLIALADGVTNVDAVIGDHTNFQVLTVRPNGVLVVENLSKGVRFTRVRLVFDLNTKQVVYKTADFHKPWNIGVTPDAPIQAEIDALNAQLQPILSPLVGNSTVAIPRSDSCGRADSRLCESLVGNITADSMRTAFGVSFPIDFAITNAGGLRAALTCPTTDNLSDFCPAFTPPPYPITLGQVLTVLPFGNVVATAPVNGAQLKQMLENGVSRIVDSTTLAVAADGRFPQVSGLCFTYNIAAPALSRVTGAVRPGPGGSCTVGTTPIDLVPGTTTYRIAINDFMAMGGDGYLNLVSVLNTPSVKTMDAVLADYITANTPVSPAIQGRITCTDSNGTGPTNLPNCPTPLP
jgi:2',3'-cyclic-nucleotide 2'-phosphodiesterase (5'-nucleotidase family)